MLSSIAPQVLMVCSRPSPSELFFLYVVLLLMDSTFFALLLWKVWQLSSDGVAPIIRVMLKQYVHFVPFVCANLLIISQRHSILLRCLLCVHSIHDTLVNNIGYSGFVLPGARDDRTSGSLFHTSSQPNF